MKKLPNWQRTISIVDLRSSNRPRTNSHGQEFCADRGYFIGPPRTPIAYYRAIAGLMQQCLELDHPACIESALHGLGHMVFSKPKIARPIIDNFLKKHRHADPELLEYARAARTGIIL